MTVRGILYNRWHQMKSRCENPNNWGYKWYGAKGITVCERWQTFENFYTDMLNGFNPELQIERINGQMGYSPDNCKWATKAEQQTNKANTTYLSVNGEKTKLVDLAKKIGITANLLRLRIKRGLSIEQAAEMPIRQKTAKKLYGTDICQHCKESFEKKTYHQKFCTIKHGEIFNNKKNPKRHLTLLQ